MVRAMALIKLFIAIELIVPFLVIALIVFLVTRKITRRVFAVCLVLSIVLFVYSSIILLSYIATNTCHGGAVQASHKLFNIRNLFCD